MYDHVPTSPGAAAPGPTPPAPRRRRHATRLLVAATTLALLAGAVSVASTTATAPPAAAATPPALSEDDVTGVWALRQGQAFTESVYGLDIAGYSIRVPWKDVEPVKGQYNWSLIDSVIARAKQGGKKVRLAVMTGTYVPDWVGAAWFTGSSDSACDAAGVRTPVPWDPNLRREQLVLINDFAARYRDEPAVAWFAMNGPSSPWGELCLPANTTQQPGYSNAVILDTWKEVIDKWASVRGNRRLSAAISATPGFYPSLGTDIANYGLSKLGREFSVQWNYLDTKFANAVGINSKAWVSKLPIGWQFWGATTWTRQTVDFQGTVDLAVNAGSTYIEIYDDDLRIASFGAYAEQAHAKMTGGSGGTAPSTTTTTTQPPSTTTTTTRPAGDTTAPSMPKNLAVGSKWDESVRLTWTASTDNVKVTGYEVTRNGTLVATVTNSTYTVSGLSANRSYTFTVRARDAAGNRSTAASISATTCRAGTSC